MDTARDLARADPWLESLERSLARRGKSRRSSTELTQLQSGRRRRGNGPSVKTLAALALLPVIFAGLVVGGAHPATPRPAHAELSAAAISASTSPPSATRRVGGFGSGGAVACRPVTDPNGYADPLAGATVRPERIDQGVDYAGSGTLSAIGAARVIYVATTGTGWPGAFIEYQLLAGANAGCYVFYAEGVIPVDGLSVGQTVSGGQPLATIIPGYPTGIEIGWGAGKGTTTYAAAAGQWSASDDQENVASMAGKSFSALIAALGGPPGKVEG